MRKFVLGFAVSTLLGTAALAMAALPSGPASAADANGNFNVAGVGLRTCGEMIQDLAANPSSRIVYVGWMNGYLSAYNREAPETFDIAPDWGALRLTALLERFCTQNPTVSYWAALGQLTEDLKPGRLTTQTNRVTLQGEEGSFTLYQTTLRAVQQKLKDLGFYRGGVDGIFGPGTSSGLLEFQKTQEGLSANGVPDDATLRALFSN